MCCRVVDWLSIVYLSFREVEQYFMQLTQTNPAFKDQDPAEAATAVSCVQCTYRQIYEARYSTSPIRNLTLTQTHTTSDVIPAMLNVVPHIHICFCNVQTHSFIDDVAGVRTRRQGPRSKGVVCGILWAKDCRRPGHELDCNGRRERPASGRLGTCR